MRTEHSQLVMMERQIEGCSEQSLARFLLRARRAARVRGQVHVLVVSNRRMRSLNRQFRGKDEPTDVLSFPAVPEVARELAGDIVISRDMAAANARRLQHPVAHEVKVLVLHGVLHLAGYDHETDRGEMARREQRMRRELNLRDGLIERSQRPSAGKSRRKR